MREHRLAAGAGGMFGCSQRKCCCRYFQLPPTEKISGNWTFQLWRYPPSALSGLTAIGHSPALPVSLFLKAVPLG
jgi:hypothetical protein